MNTAAPAFECTACGREYPQQRARWRCDCGEILVVQMPTHRFRSARGRTSSWWRYSEMLPLLPREQPVMLGDVVSPMAPVVADGTRVLAKLDFVSATGSFKDRGASVIATRLAHWGVEECAVDSSGNAGIASAAYFARAGIRCSIFVPAYTTPGKVRLMRQYGATVVLVDGSREDATRAALQRSSETFYGGQTRSPFFRLGGFLWALEVCDELGRAPDAIVLPTGSGSLLLGVALAFRSLAANGWGMPRIYAAQAARCAPLVDAAERGLPTIDAAREWEPTVAEGIATARPIRSAEMLQAVRQSGGVCIAVGDDEIESGRDELLDQGLYVEPTGAVGFAGVKRLRRQEVLPADALVVTSLTGGGQKLVAES